MASISGKSGFVKYDGGTEITGIKSWTIDAVADALETTDFADAGVRSFIAGCTSWSGSFEGYKEGATPAILSGTVYSGDFGESDTTGQHWTGDILITGSHASVSFDGVVAYSYDFQGTGALTDATA